MNTMHLKYIHGHVTLHVINIIKANHGAVVVVIVWQLDLQLAVQSVPIITEVVSSNPVPGKVYVIKFVSDLRQVGGFLQFPPPIKLTATI